MSAINFKFNSYLCIYTILVHPFIDAMVLNANRCIPKMIALILLESVSLSLSCGQINTANFSINVFLVPSYVIGII